MERRQHRYVECLWYASLLAIDAVFIFLIGLCTVASFQWVDNEWAATLAEMTVSVAAPLLAVIMRYSRHLDRDVPFGGQGF